MPTVEIAIPPQTKYNDKELKEFFVAKLFEDGVISTGTGAKMLNVERKDFMLLLAKYNVCYLDYDLSPREKKVIADARNT